MLLSCSIFPMCLVLRPERIWSIKSLAFNIQMIKAVRKKLDVNLQLRLYQVKLRSLSAIHTTVLPCTQAVNTGSVNRALH